MSIVLELRQRYSHAGIPLVHPTSEDVIVSNVFGVLKNISSTVINAWLQQCTTCELPSAQSWHFSFWDKQPKPVGVSEGSTEIDIVLDSVPALVSIEAKIDAQPSQGTKSDPHRNQLLRNLDIGYARARSEGKAFALVLLTPSLSEPDIVRAVRSCSGPYPANAGVDPREISRRLYWSSWETLGASFAACYVAGELHPAEAAFVRDTLAYLAAKRLWKNTLPDEPAFYEDKLYRPLRRSDSVFTPYQPHSRPTYQAWRTKAWDEPALRSFVLGLRVEDQALLQLIAEAGGAMQQRAIMTKLPFLRGKTSASLRSLKSHINGGCKQLDRAPLLAEGNGQGDWRIHEINHNLGKLRDVVIEEAKTFSVPWHLLERELFTRFATVDS